MSKIKVIYYTDALCGWCYGFSDVVNQIYHKFNEDISFELYHGGLFIGERSGRVNDIAPYIKKGAYKSVEEVTGTMFGKKFLDIVQGSGNMILNSLYPTMASVIVKQLKPSKLFDFNHLMNHAFYNDGVSSDDILSLSLLVESFGISQNEFITLMSDKSIVELAYEEFAITQSADVRSYPTIKIYNDQTEVLTLNGYKKYSVLETELNDVLAGEL